MRGLARPRTPWRDGRQAVRRLEIPQPFELTNFVTGIAESRGRAIELVSVDTMSLTPCGALIATERADYICYPARTTKLHQRHIIFHEIAHLVSGDVDNTNLDPQRLAGLVPSLSGELVRRVLGRSSYDDPTERRAEIIATLLAQRTGSAPVEVRPTADLGGGLSRLIAVLDGRSTIAPV